MKRKKILFIVLTVCLIALMLVSYNLTAIKKGYIIAFNKSAIIGHLNVNGKLNGEVDNYMNGRLKQKANVNNGILNGWTIDYYPDGAIKTRSFFKHDKLDSVKLDYYPDGKIKTRETYKNGKYEGLKIKYYTSGQIENRSFFKDDMVNGTEYEYYKSGTLKYTRDWINSKLYGDQYFYYENKKEKIYHVYDILGEKFYLSNYNESGEIIKSEGYPFSGNIYSKTHDSTIILKNNGKYNSINDLYITVANPPHTTTEIKITINNKLCEKLNFVDDNNTLKIANAFSKKGKYNVIIQGFFVDKTNVTSGGTACELTVIKE